jgi:SAM-dependent methyltransferase
LNFPCTGLFPAALRNDEIPMKPSEPRDDRGYDAFYRAFESAAMRRVRREAYGEDIGQHSWVTVEELERDVGRLELSRASRLLDLGCGPCGPLTFVTGLVGCHGTGIDVSQPALDAGRARIAAAHASASITLIESDSNEPIPAPDAAFDAVMSFDVILHLRDRASAFREVARVLTHGGKFLFTDAGVITGAVSAEEIALRATHGHTQFVPPLANQQLMEGAGLRLVASEDRTASLLRIAAARLTARLAHQSELEPVEGAEAFERQRRYLETVTALARRGAMSRWMYLAAK